MRTNLKHATELPVIHEDGLYAPLVQGVRNKSMWPSLFSFLHRNGIYCNTESGLVNAAYLLINC